MVSRLVERRVRDKLQYETPSWKQIFAGHTEVSISIEKIFTDEKNLIEQLIIESDIASLVARYPIRDPPSLECVSKSLGFLSQENYEQAVRKMLCDSEEERKKVADIISPISVLLLDKSIPTEPEGWRPSPRTLVL